MSLNRTYNIPNAWFCHLRTPSSHVLSGSWWICRMRFPFHIKTLFLCWNYLGFQYIFKSSNVHLLCFQLFFLNCNELPFPPPPCLVLCVFLDVLYANCWRFPIISSTHQVKIYRYAAVLRFIYLVSFAILNPISRRKIYSSMQCHNTSQCSSQFFSAVLPT